MKICPYKNLYTDFHSSIIQNSQRADTAPKLSTDEYINKIGYINTMEYYLTVKGDKELTHATYMDEP